MNRPKNKHRKTVLYIAGPMTGIDNHNLDAFNAAQRVLESVGYATLNPARHEAVDGRDWYDYMRLGITDILEADHVALLPGWDKSKGALLEVSVANGINKFTEPIDYWISEAMSR